ncbi:Nitroreductase [Actinopolymorpha cephalotaxi]|uniref:Nitroreductase n=1 Tax=Actinopolymorpha cephalotaxi TaxID=504797 RepID=A0A1I2THY9_9ACTN|nr:nitroreductase family protein [Actinopolymorpha cephalotaxi]NYH83098.1 nitroreductase [Actinopolymorpha cephalotaxi]SFG64510.1 Nitroreductase [Actinopolymorpha cephalotaxi]
MSSPIDTQATDLLLTTTRAVRKRLDLDRPVPREVLLDCIRLAVQAPTGSNQQGWRWVIVTDPDKRARLGELYRSGGAANMRAARQAESRGAQQDRVQDSARYLMEVIDRVPALVIPCIEGRITDVRHAAGFFGSIHPAVWSFQLALRSRGLGSAWTSFHLAHEEETAELLGIPPDVTQAALLPVAYTIGTDFKPATRRPVEEITYWDSWGHVEK